MNTEHGRPLTRREFVTRGLVAAGGVALAPSALSLFSRSAQATSATKHVPFITFDLAGGAALPANFLVGKSGGPEDLLKTYSLLGWDPRQTKIDARFGLPMANSTVSQMLAGILAASSSTAQSNFRMASLLHQGQSDSTMNPLNVLSLLSRSGVTGSELAKSLGTSATSSGGNSRFASEDIQYRPLSVLNVEDITEALSLSAVYSKLPLKSTQKILNTLQRISSRQLAQATADQALRTSFDEKHSQFYASLGKSLVDPRLDPIISKIYGLQANTPSNSRDAVRAAMVSAILRGLSGPGVITIGGCDYHDGTQTTGDAKDKEIGVEIGRAIESAAQLKSPVFIHLITDGGIYAENGTRFWKGDTNETCMSVIGYYDPSGPRAFHKNQMQIGAYTDAQGADRNTTIGDNPLMAAYAAFANYMQIDGRLGDFDKIGGKVISKAQIDSFLAFEG